MVMLNDVCDYIILKVVEAGASLNLLKLQKLMYYVQAWRLAFTGQPLFDGKFQAWVHGPVSRELYDRFAQSKSLYSDVTADDVVQGFNPETALGEEQRNHIDMVLESYAGFSGSQLEAMTHSEAPWQNARKGFQPSQRCEQVINEADMAAFYKRRYQGREGGNMSDRETKATDPARDLCESLARHVEVSGSEIYGNNQRLNNQVVTCVWCVVGQHAAEFDAMVREWLRANGRAFTL